MTTHGELCELFAQHLYGKFLWFAFVENDGFDVDMFDKIAIVESECSSMCVGTDKFFCFVESVEPVLPSVGGRFRFHQFAHIGGTYVVLFAHSADECFSFQLVGHSRHHFAHATHIGGIQVAIVGVRVECHDVVNPRFGHGTEALAQVAVVAPDALCESVGVVAVGQRYDAHTQAFGQQ